ncbi:hypothetical protein HHI36_002611 [Cryptolaemus montrouzieri]|uniref:Uncharacterized protein n=1 Tax=Cryptolaemus montrouzieri TaxID=559131 RepID=A0ABD2PBH4_9CUCU
MSSSSTVKNKVASKEKVSLAKLAKYNPLNNDMQLFRASLWEVIKDYEPKLKALYQDAISSKTRLPRDDERCYCPVIILLLESVHKQVIKAINWKNFPMSGEVFLTFISFCEKYNTLNTLRLEDSCLQEDDITLLAIFLRSNSNVTDLNLSGNSYQKNFNSLIIDNKLKYLTLKFCGINDEGIAQLIKPLKNAFQPVLLHLNVSHNNIGEKGAEQIAAMLRVNRILISLNLGCNKITDLGAKKILSSLQSFRLNQEEISKRRKIYYQYYIIKFKELKESGLSVSPSVETKLLTTKTSSTSTMKLLKGQRSSKSKQRRKLSRSATSLSECE